MRHRLLQLRLRLFMRHLAASRRPIIVGPHHRELGFEILYWIPFVQQLRADYHLEKGRLVALSRGGLGPLYDMAGSSDIYDFLPVETVRLHALAAQQRQQSSKQYGVEPWERHLVALAASSLGLEQPLMLHPSWMYQLLHPAWVDKMAMKPLSTWLNPTPLPLLPLPAGLTLPERFIAVRVYARATMQAHDGVTLYLKQQFAKLAKKQPLVFLSSAERYDDHADIIRPFGDNMLELSIGSASTNLAVQVAVLQRAAMFIGTYGGLAQTALRVGKPTVALYTEWGGTAFAHVDLTHRLALAGGVPFYLMQAQALEQLEALW